jgi:hypothetical protein
MTTSSQSNHESSEPLSFEKFSEPRTMPAHWDLSALTAGDPGRETPVEAQAAPQPGFGDDPEAAGQDDLSTDGYRNPFPQPRTYPALWDLSG